MMKFEIRLQICETISLLTLSRASFRVEQAISPELSRIGNDVFMNGIKFTCSSFLSTWNMYKHGQIYFQF
jgi:hypothetical protein